MIFYLDVYIIVELHVPLRALRLFRRRRRFRAKNGSPAASGSQTGVSPPQPESVVAVSSFLSVLRAGAESRAATSVDDVTASSALCGVLIGDGASYTVSQVGGDVVIDLVGGARMVLSNVALSSLSDGWIVSA